MLALRLLSREIVQQKKTGSDKGVCGDQPRPAGANENEEHEDQRCCSDSDGWKRKDFRRDGSHCSHRRQTHERLARRTKQFHRWAVGYLPRNKTSMLPSELNCHGVQSQYVTRAGLPASRARRNFLGARSIRAKGRC